MAPSLITGECLSHALLQKQSSIILYPIQSKDVNPLMLVSTCNSLKHDQGLGIEQGFFQNSSSQSHVSLENLKNSKICFQTVNQDEQKENINPLNNEHLACKEKHIHFRTKCELEDFSSDSGLDLSDSRADSFECSDQKFKSKCDFHYPSKKVLLTSNFEITDAHDKFPKKQNQDIVYPSKSEKQITQNINYLLINEETKDNNYQVKYEKIENQNINQPINKEVETQDITYKIKNEKAVTQGIEHKATSNKRGETQDIKHKIKKEKAEETEMQSDYPNFRDIKHLIMKEKVETQDFERSDQKSKRKCDFHYPSKKVLFTSNFEITDAHDKFLKKNKNQDIVYPSKSEKQITQNINSLLINEETKDNNYQVKYEKIENQNINQPINKEVETQDITYKIKNEKAVTQGIEHKATSNEREETQDIKHKIKNEKVEETEMQSDDLNFRDIKHLMKEKVETQDKYQLKNEKAETLCTNHQAINEDDESQGIKYRIKKEKVDTSDLTKQPLMEEDSKNIKYKAINFEYQMKVLKTAITFAIKNDVSLLTRKSSRCLCIQGNSKFCSVCPLSQEDSQKIDTDCAKEPTKTEVHCNGLVVEKLIQNVAYMLSLNGYESSPCFRDAQGLVRVLIQMLKVMMLPTFLATFVHSTTCTKDHSKLCSMFKRLIHHVVNSNHHCALKEIYGHILRLHLDSCSQNECTFPKCQILRENRKKIFD